MAQLVFVTILVDFYATLVSYTVGKETPDGSHVAYVSPPNSLLTFQKNSKAPLPLSLKGGLAALPLTASFPRSRQDNQLATLLAPKYLEN